MVITSTVVTFVVIKARKHLTRENIKLAIQHLFSDEHPRLPRARNNKPIKTAFCGGQMLIVRT